MMAPFLEDHSTSAMEVTSRINRMATSAKTQFNRLQCFFGLQYKWLVKAVLSSLVHFVRHLDNAEIAQRMNRLMKSENFELFPLIQLHLLGVLFSSLI